MYKSLWIKHMYNSTYSFVYKITDINTLYSKYYYGFTAYTTTRRVHSIRVSSLTIIIIIKRSMRACTTFAYSKRRVINL